MAAVHVNLSGWTEAFLVFLYQGKGKVPGTLLMTTVLHVCCAHSINSLAPQCLKGLPQRFNFLAQHRGG